MHTIATAFGVLKCTVHFFLLQVDVPQQPSGMDVTSDDEEDGFIPGMNGCGVLTALNCGRFLAGVEEHHKPGRSNRRGHQRSPAITSPTWVAAHMARPMTPLVMEQARGSGLRCLLHSAVQQGGHITAEDAASKLRQFYPKTR